MPWPAQWRNTQSVLKELALQVEESPRGGQGRGGYRSGHGWPSWRPLPSQLRAPGPGPFHQFWYHNYTAAGTSSVVDAAPAGSVANLEHQYPAFCARCPGLSAAAAATSSC